jgi:hypothetical protein
MKNLTKTILGGLAIGFISCALFSQQAQAAQINGSILMVGRVNFDQPIGGATTVTTFFDVVDNSDMSSVLLRTGDFGGIPPFTSATMAHTWTFDPSTATQGLWSVGGFTFDLMSATVVMQDSDFLNVLGTGIISANGFDPTQATFRFTVTGTGQDELGFAGLTIAVGQGVPDGGSAVALLGLALIGIEGLRRKLRARKG